MSMHKTYAVNGITESGTASKTGVNIIASTAIRPAIAEWSVGTGTAPNSTDQQYLMWVGRTTAVGTAASNPTPLAIDGGDTAAVATAGITHSSEPTYAATGFFDQGFNQRQAFRWVYNSTPLYSTASANNGIGFKLVSVSNAMVLRFVVHFIE